MAHEPGSAPDMPGRHLVVEDILAWLFICRGILAMQPCQERMESDSASSFNLSLSLLCRLTVFASLLDDLIHVQG
jgi:hypothetical protein